MTTAVLRLQSIEGVGAFELAALAVARKDEKPLLATRGAPILPDPPHVREAVEEAMSCPSPLHPRGFSELREAIARQLSTDRGIPADPDKHLVMTHGAMQGLSVALRAIAGDGDEIIVPAPSFFFHGLITSTGAKPVYVPSTAADGWRWDLDRIVQSISPATKAILICNPNNPTGYLPSPSDLATLTEIADKHGLYIVSDESYQRFIHDDHEQVDLAGFGLDQKNLVTVTSLSKNYALTQWRVGYVLGAQQVIDVISRVFNWDALYLGNAQQRAAQAVVAGPQDWIVAVLREYQAKRDFLLSGLRRLEALRVETPQAGMLDVCGCVSHGPFRSAVGTGATRSRRRCALRAILQRAAGPLPACLRRRV